MPSVFPPTSSCRICSPARRAELRASAERLVADQVYPVWRKAKALLEAEASKASDDAGLWRLPKGADVYSYSLRRYTTTKLTADEIHQTGLRMVAEIEGR